jgi:hypothetical protein
MLAATSVVVAGPVAIADLSGATMSVAKRHPPATRCLRLSPTVRWYGTILTTT